VGIFKKNKTKIAINPSRKYLEMGLEGLAPILESADVFIVNREEGAYLTGISFDEKEAIFRKIMEKAKGIAVMTDGDRGAWICDGKRIYEAGVFPQEKIADKTGAGDAFGSGLVASLMRVKSPEYSERDIENAIRLASANAVSVIEHVGAQKGILTKSAFSHGRWGFLPVNIRSL
jgi:sugar/nucleoside kinase (ribokinase family)